MGLSLRLRRWLALRGVPRLVPDSPEGTTVQATGVVRALEDPIIAPVANVPSVVVWAKHLAIGNPNDRRKTSPPIERFHLRPFVLELELSHVIVDAGHARLLRPMRAEGMIQEIVVAVGERVTVVGSVLRDGIELPVDDVAFREAKIACKLVGSRAHPIVITDVT